MSTMTTLSQERFLLHPTETTQPKYERFKSFVLAELQLGHLNPGDSLPSEPRLASSLNVARSTIRQAFRELEQEGVIERLPGQGTFIRETVSEEKEDAQGVDNFAIIVPETMGGTIYLPLMSSFEKACNRIHSEMLVRSTNNSPVWQADAILALLYKRIGGVAIVPATSQPTPPYQIHLLQQQGVPVVFCHRGVKGINAPTLAIDFKEVGRIAARQLLKQGHKKITYLALSPVGEQVKINCELGLQEVLRENGLELDQEFTYLPPNDLKLPIINYAESVRQWLKDMLSHEDRPTAIFTSFDPLAEMVLTLLWELGVQVPEEISLLSFGPACRESLILQKISAITIDSIAMGQKACDLLVEMRNGKRPIDRDEQIEVPLELWEGKTLGPPSSTA